ncbi:MAG: hypothetical protein HLUCCX14_15180 [Marinobacter excellens HL-55]|uniref:Uncharacterized protein n=1 Tax=Marinobacter excellens HL-55 TaxID=1305731 RepID=A0A0P8BGE1_9GAMM|nr:MAG: hypothetical protein HLUCCX14_15180 [Marinobacter excellens HL-55]
MILAPIGYLSPAHLSEKDRSLANLFGQGGSSISYAPTQECSIFFSFLALDLIVLIENVGDRKHLLDELSLIRKAGFSNQFCKIIYDAFSAGLKYVLFHEYGPEDPKYSILSHEYHVLGS